MLTGKKVAAKDTGGTKMFCHCGECPKEIPRRDTYVCVCSRCFEGKEGWMDVNLVYTKCDKCGRTTYCHAEEKKEEPEWKL